MEVTSYEYDGLKRLTSESVTTGNTTDTYAYKYDDYGNRAEMAVTGSENYTTVYRYSDSQGKYKALLISESKTSTDEKPLPGFTTTAEKTTYTYDKNGSQLTKTTSEKTETNTYNAVNQLVGFTDGETTASYAYNASGLRYEKTVNGETINHVWDGSNQIIADVVESQFYEANCYVRGTNLLATYSFVNGAKSGYTYYIQNAHGDVVNLTNAEGAVTKSYTYDAFGVEKNIADSDENAFRYCGEYFDTETGTIYLRARYYNPATGRFTQRDSYVGRNEDPLSLNLYSYCYNNPVQFVDPTGHSPLALLALSIAAAAVVVGVTTLAVASSPSGQEALRSATKAVSDLADNVSSKFNAAKNTLLFVTLAGITEIISKAKKSTITKDTRNKRNQDVYLLYDPQNNNSIEYVGRTNDAKQREASHKASKSRGDLEMVVIASDISYSAARGLEQFGIMYYDTLDPVLLSRDPANAKNNQINGISPANPYMLSYYIEAAPYIYNLEQIMYTNEKNVQLTFRDPSRNEEKNEEEGS